MLTDYLNVLVGLLALAGGAVAACRHGYTVDDSCPNCDAEGDR